MVVAAPTGHPALYDTLVALHVACAVVGFGAVALSGVYGAAASHTGRSGSAAEETRRYFRSPGRAEWLVLPVPFLGAAALALRPEGAAFGDAWVVAASVIWVAATVVLLGVVRPAESRIRTSVRSCDAKAAAVRAGAGPEPPPSADPLAVTADRRGGAGVDATAGGPTVPSEQAGVGTTLGDLAGAGRMLKWGAAGCDLLFVAALVLMIGQPA